MPSLDEFMLAKLAREMAMNIRKYDEIFKDYNIDENDYYEIEKLPYYQRAKEQFTLEWNSTLSVKDRVSLISATGLEQGLSVICARMMNPLEPLAAAIDAAKMLAKNAGIGEPKVQNGSAADRFVITINLGADMDGKQIVEKYDKSIAIDANNSPSAGATSIPQVSATLRNAEDAGPATPPISFQLPETIPNPLQLSATPSNYVPDRTVMEAALNALMEHR